MKTDGFVMDNFMGLSILHRISSAFICGKGSYIYSLKLHDFLLLFAAEDQVHKRLSGGSEGRLWSVGHGNLRMGGL